VIDAVIEMKDYFLTIKDHVAIKGRHRSDHQYFLLHVDYQTLNLIIALNGA
jgi:hypothetical protein